LAQHREQPVVEPFQVLVHGLDRTSTQVGGDPLPSCLELALMEEAQPRRQVGDDGRRLVRTRRERSGRPRFVVVLQEAGQPALVVEPCVEMLAHRPRLAAAEAVVEAFVVRVVEPLLLQLPLEVPVDLGHEAEARHPLPHPPRRIGPEGRRPAAPGPLEDVGQDEHRHVAAHAVALPGDPELARRSSSASGTSSSVVGRPRAWESSVSQTRVLIW
jgi:hypothetical protein